MKRSEQQKLEHIVSRMQADRSTNAPANAIRYAKNLFRTRVTEPAKPLIHRLLATLRVDLAPNQAAFGERSSAEGKARQMLFDSDDNAVDIRITVSGKGFDLRGQILGDGFENGEAELTGEQLSIKSKTGEISEFTFIGIAAGDYKLTIRSGDSEIFIDPLKVG